MKLLLSNATCRWFGLSVPALVVAMFLAVAAAALGSHTVVAAPGAGSLVDQATCGQWNVTGTWQTTQNGSIPISFTFQQSGTQVQGNASAPSLTLNGPLSGTLNGNQLSVVVTWSASTQGNYSGTVQQGQIVKGHTFQVGSSSSSGPSWTGTGPTTCADSGTSGGTAGSGGSSSQANQSCSWAGQWLPDSNGTLTLTQSGSQVSGGDGGSYTVSGTVSGNAFTGGWKYGGDFGDLNATIDPSCNKITGTQGGNRYNGASGVAGTHAITWTRVGGSSTSTPTQTSGGQTQKLGSINWNGYCQSLGGSGASLDGGTLNDWHCVDAAGKHVGIDPGAACQWQYGTNIAKWDTFNDPNSWACFGSASSSPQTLRIRPDAAGGCTAWNGSWDSDFGTLKLTTSGSSVSGTYDYLGGKVTGTVSGNTLTGTWSEQDTYQPPNDAGDLQFTFNSDGSFSGQWRYGSSGDWSAWNGTCAS
jgi:hypothetical protein